MSRKTLQRTSIESPNWLMNLYLKGSVAYTMVELITSFWITRDLHTTVSVVFNHQVLHLFAINNTEGSIKKIISYTLLIWCCLLVLVKRPPIRLGIVWRFRSSFVLRRIVTLPCFHRSSCFKCWMTCQLRAPFWWKIAGDRTHFPPSKESHCLRCILFIGPKAAPLHQYLNLCCTPACI